MRFDYQRAALALIAVSVAGLYGAAISGATNILAARPATPAALAWVALPERAPAPAVRPAPPSAPAPVKVSAPPPAKTLGPLALADLRARFTAAAFDLRAVRDGTRPVPRLFVRALPRDYATLREAKEIKRTFIKTVLPLALKVNEEILDERHQLLLLNKQKLAGVPFSDEQQQWLVDLAARYDTDVDDMAELIRRVDVVSPSLALAQSAEESGWGRSRFALKGNALFGQRTWTQGKGLVPGLRDDDASHEVRKFPSLLDSVRSYAQNLNGHPAYEQFRARRAEMRAAETDFDPYRLIETLTAYSERGGDYVETIQTIMRIDHLQELEHSYLRGQPHQAPLQLTQLETR